MSKIMISAAAFAVAISCLATGAVAKETANQATKRLNQQQLTNQPTYTTGAPRMANEATTTQAVTAPPEQAPVEVYVAGAAHTAMDATREPDTNPQSYGTPSIDTPYVAIVPAQK